MKGCRLLDDSRVMNLKNDITPCASELLDTLWIPNSSPAAAGTASMINFDIHDDDRSCDQPPEKKRRLTADQVRFLEKSFDVENKLEPHRKTQLAKELGLQPRQVAIWFQNRRARCKTKVLEKEYDSLKSCYDKLKADYDALFSDNEKLKNEVSLLSQNDAVAKDASSSGRSDVFDSDSSGAWEIASHHVFGRDQSEFSLDEDVRLSFPKLEAECYDEFDLHPNSCNLGFPAQNQGTWFWQI